jgi:hypothetical protein
VREIDEEITVPLFVSGRGHWCAGVLE